MPFILFLFSAMFLACSSAEEAQSSGNYCGNSADCKTGELCLERSCQLVECITSRDCTLHHFCTDTFECQSGCLEDTDCFNGETCNTETRECQTSRCRNTELDCDVGEFCQPETGECYTTDHNFCQPCSYEDYRDGLSTGICLTEDFGGTCQVDFFGEHSGCPAGDICLPNTPPGFQDVVDGTCYTMFNSLYVDQLTQGECPAGFVEGPVLMTDRKSCESDFDCDPDKTCDGGQCVYYSESVCSGNCRYFLEQGHLQ